MHYTAVVMDSKGVTRNFAQGGQPCWGVLSEFSLRPGNTLTEIHWRPEFSSYFVDNRSKSEYEAEFKEIFDLLFKDSDLKYSFSKNGKVYDTFHVRMDMGDSLVQDTMCRLFAIRNTVEYGHGAMYHEFRKKGYTIRECIMISSVINKGRTFSGGGQRYYGYLSCGDENLHHKSTKIVDIRYFARTGKIFCQGSEVKFSDGKGGYIQNGRMLDCLARNKDKGVTLSDAFKPMTRAYSEKRIAAGGTRANPDTCDIDQLGAFVEHLFGKPSEK